MASQLAGPLAGCVAIHAAEQVRVAIALQRGLDLGSPCQRLLDGPGWIGARVDEQRPELLVVVCEWTVSEPVAQFIGIIGIEQLPQ